MKKNKIYLGIGVVAIILLASIVMFSNQEKKDDYIKIGLIYPLTGPSSDVGIQHVEGVLFAVDKINNAGGVNGKQIKVYIEDSQGQASEGVNAFNKLTNINDVKIIFGTLSNVMLAITPLAEESQVILFADASHPQLTNNKSYIFRHAITAVHISKKMVEYTKDDVSVAAIVFQNNDAGIEFNNELTKNINNKYDFVKIVSEPYNMAHSDFKTQVQKVLRENPDVIYLMGLGNSYGIWIKQLRELGYSGDIISDFAPIIVPSSLDVAGEHAKGLIYANYDQNLVEEYNELFYEYNNKRSIGSFSFITFGNVELMANTISEVGEDNLLIANHLRNMPYFVGTVENMTFFGQDILPPFEMYVYE